MRICTHSLRSFVWCDVNDCIQRTEFVIHINQFSHLTSDLYSRMPFLDTETRLDWIQITSTWKHTWIQFQFTGGAFLCQETTFMSTNQKSNVKIDWYEQQIRFSECSCSYHITQMSEANECNWTNIKSSSLFICQSNSVHMSIKFSSLFICQSNLIFCFIPSYYAHVYT